MGQRERQTRPTKPANVVSIADLFEGLESPTGHVLYPLYGNGHTGIEYVTRQTPAERLVVTFSDYGSLNIHAPGYAEAFLLKRGFDVLMLKCNINNWFQDLSREQLQETFAQLPAYQDVLTYGSNMGGYAAMYFADAVGARAAIAMSPQISVDPEIVPFDPRWSGDGARIEFQHEPLAKVLHETNAVHYVLFDPKNPDRLHVEMMLAASDRVLPLPLPYTGHPVGVALQEMGLLAPTFDALADGQVPDIRGMLRKRRRKSPVYMFQLAKMCVARGHNAAADHLFAQVCSRDAFTEAQVEYSRFLLSQNKPKQALAMLEKAWPSVAHNAHFTAYRAHLHQVAGNIDEALESFDAAIARDPDAVIFYQAERSLMKDIVQQQRNEARLTASALARAKAELTLKRGADPDKLDAKALSILIGLPLLVLTVLIVIVISFHLI